MSKQRRNKNIPLILVGIISLLAITSLRSQIGGGVTISIIQVCAFAVILYGFGMSWTRKEASATKRTYADSSSNLIDSNELIKAWKEIINGDKTWGWKPVVASIAHINSIPHHVIDTAEVTSWSRKYNFPKQVKGYTGVLWIAREDTPYKPNHMLIFSPVFNNITDIKLWNKVPLMLCPDIESWLEIKEASEKTLIIDDDIKMTPLTNDKDFSILTALLKTKHYKDIK